MTDFFIPPDNEELRERYENTPKRGGTCGVAAIAALHETTVASVISRWVGKGKWPGYSPVRELQATLEAMGYSVKRVRGGRAKQFPTISPDRAAIVRIQWLDKDGKEFPWFEAARHTHYVLLKWFDGDAYVFCNSVGWFPAYGVYALNYLKQGYVSSFIEVSK